MPSLIEIGQLVLEKKIFKYFECIFTFLLFCDYLPLEKGNPLHLNNLESPPPKDDLCQVWLEVENVKVYRQTDGQTGGQRTDGQRAIRIAHLSFQLR
jgi:hypothetical protein